MIQVYAVNIEEDIEYGVWDKLLNRISEDRREKVLKCSVINDKKACIFGECIIIYYMKILNKIQDYNIKLDKNGKPFFANYSEINFSISHSGSWVICAFGNHQLGVDIERNGQNNLAIAKRFFSESENEALDKILEISEKYKYFYYLWTLKESFLKKNGIGLSGLNKSICFRKLLGNIVCYHQNKIVNNYFYSTIFMRDYSLALCYDKEDEFNSDKNICVLNRQDLILKILSNK